MSELDLTSLLEGQGFDAQRILEQQSAQRIATTSPRDPDEIITAYGTSTALAANATNVALPVIEPANADEVWQLRRVSVFDSADIDPNDKVGLFYQVNVAPAVTNVLLQSATMTPKANVPGALNNPWVWPAPQTAQNPNISSALQQQPVQLSRRDNVSSYLRAAAFVTATGTVGTRSFAQVVQYTRRRRL